MFETVICHFTCQIVRTYRSKGLVPMNRLLQLLVRWQASVRRVLRNNVLWVYRQLPDLGAQHDIDRPDVDVEIAVLVVKDRAAVGYTIYKYEYSNVHLVHIVWVLQNRT